MPVTPPTRTRTAKLFRNNRSQAVRLPKEFEFDANEVYIRREGEDIVLSTKPLDWKTYLATAPAASPEFMEGVDDPLPEDRDLFS